MDEDEEKFYDSLDEDPNFDEVPCIQKSTSDIISVHSGDVAFINDLKYSGSKESKDGRISPSRTTLPDEEISTETQEQNEPKSERSNRNSAVTKIPLYIGETNKDDLKLNPKYKRTILHQKKKKSTTCLSCSLGSNENTKRKVNYAVTKEKKPPKSYFDIYLKKHGILTDTDGKSLPETVKSIYGGNTSRTFTTYISNCALSGPAWDAPSAFEKYMPQNYASRKKIQNIATEDNGSEDFASSNSSYDEFHDVYMDNLKSVSQVELRTFNKVSINSKVDIINDQKTENKTSKSKTGLRDDLKYTSNNSKQITLKHSFVDQNKLDLIKRRLEYGKMASNRNRVKILLSKSKLEQE